MAKHGVTEWALLLALAAAGCRPPLDACAEHGFDRRDRMARCRTHGAGDDPVLSADRRRRPDLHGDRQLSVAGRRVTGGRGADGGAAGHHRGGRSRIDFARYCGKPLALTRIRARLA